MLKFEIPVSSYIGIACPSRESKRCRSIVSRERALFPPSSRGHHGLCCPTVGDYWNRAVDHVSASRIFASIAVTSFILTGFVKNMSMPLANASSCAESSPSPVIATMIARGQPLAISKRRIARVDSKPFMTGMLMSISTTSGLIDRFD